MNNALFSSKNMDWCTPVDFFQQLDAEFHFDLDAAASDKNAKCTRYFTKKEDGLKMDWGGYHVFCNPPYGREIAKWVQKAWAESRKYNTLVVMLIPARTDTEYWHNYIFNKAMDIRFIKGRLKFTDANGTPYQDKKGRPMGAPFPSAVVVWSSGR